MLVVSHNLPWWWGGVHAAAATDRAPIPHNRSERLLFNQLYETLVRVDFAAVVSLLLSFLAVVLVFGLETGYFRFRSGGEREPQAAQQRGGEMRAGPVQFCSTAGFLSIVTLQGFPLSSQNQTQDEDLKLTGEDSWFKQ
mgnify:CR=1 FL=1